MKQALKQVLNDLDAIAASGHDEVSDTEVREEMHDVVHHTLVEPEEGYQLPDNFRMFSDEGNALVKAVLERLIVHPEYIAAKKLSSPAARLAAFQDIDVKSDQNMFYDEYFGYDDSYES